MQCLKLHAYFDYCTLNSNEDVENNSTASIYLNYHKLFLLKLLIIILHEFIFCFSYSCLL